MSEPRVIQINRATVIYTYNNPNSQKLYVQAIDAYRNQRELTVSIAGNEVVLHAYIHPHFRRMVPEDKRRAQKFIARFMELVDKYPTLLFNEKNDNYASNDGFVHCIDDILAEVPLINVLPPKI